MKLHIKENYKIFKEDLTLKHNKSTSFADNDITDYHYYDIMQDSIKVGTIEIVDCFNDDNDICYVDRIDVNEEYRGQGIGTKVLTELLQDLGYWKVVVAPDNPNAKRLYQRIGRNLESCYLDTENDFGYNDQGYGIYVI
jgi:ribosomal protein S18 acetylase RimI-like enzyme